MNVETIRHYCLQKAGVIEDLPFGPDTLVFRVEGKIFLLLSLDEHPPRFNVKCNPDLALELREQYHCVLPGYHMNKKHWNTVVVDGTVPDKVLREWIDHSFELVGRSVTNKTKKK